MSESRESEVERPLHEIANEIRTSANHPAAANQRTIAVGIDSQGKRYAGSSNGFDRGQKDAAERLGVERVKQLHGLHAEEELMAAVPDLVAIGTSKRFPCGPDERNCLGQLRERGIRISNEERGTGNGQ